MNRVKVAFPLGDEKNCGVENMYAQPLGGNKYILDNSPFYVFDISYCDEFFADDINGEIVFSGIASRGGHSTYRVKIPRNEPHKYFLKYWQDLEKLGCTYEGSSANMRRLYTIDMPPSVDVHKAYAILERYENQDLWEFEEGHYCSGVQSH